MKSKKEKQEKERIILGMSSTELIASGHRACAGCGAAIAMRIMMKAAGKNTIVAHATGCMEVITSPYPETSWRVPWIHVAFENAAAVASGIYRALKIEGKDKETNVIAFAGDGGTYDIGLQALSGAFERREKICFVCYDNDAYMNTGVQRSGSTPKYMNTTTTPVGKLMHGKTEFQKPLPLIMAAHKGYIATANIAFPQDFYNKIKKALAFDGPSYVEVYTPCIPGWKINSDSAIEIAKLAFDTKMTPLYEVENQFVKFTMKPANPKPIKEFLMYQGRFKHLKTEEIADIQKHIEEDFANLELMEKYKIRL